MFFIIIKNTSNSNHHPLMGLKKVQYDQWYIDVHDKIGKVIALQREKLYFPPFFSPPGEDEEVTSCYLYNIYMRYKRVPYYREVICKQG